MRNPRSQSARARRQRTALKILQCIRRTRRRGNILTFFALLIPFIFAFVMLTVDIGLMTVDRTQLQRTADAVALAAVQELGDPDTATAIANTKAIAVEYAQDNSVLNDLAIEFDPDNDIVFGQSRVNPDTGEAEFVPNAMPPNALSVTVHHNLQHTAFARFWGKDTTRISTTALASKKERDYMIVLDVSCPTTYESYESDVCSDLQTLGLRDCEIEDQDKDKDADEETDKDTNEEADKDTGEEADKDTDEEADKDTNEEADKDTDEEADKDTDEEADKDTDEEADKDTDEEADKDTDEEADKDTDEEADKDTDEEADKDTDEEADKDTDEEADKDTDKDKDCCVCTFDGKDADEFGSKDQDKDEDEDADDEPSAMETALSLTYDGNDAEFWGIYEVGERFLPPSVRIQPLKAIKDSATYAVDILGQSGYDDLLGTVAYSDQANWIEPLTTNYARIRARIRGAAPFEGGRLDLGLQAAREELLSSRARGGSHKTIVIVSTGNSDSGQALAEAQLAADAGMTIHCIGIGSDVDQNLLNTIAAMTGGEVVYVELSDDPSVYEAALKTIFSQVSLERVHSRLMQSP